MEQLEYGRCAVCDTRQKLRKDRSIGKHSLRPTRSICTGSHQKQKVLAFNEGGRPDCGDCLMWIYGRENAAFLVESIYSVAIETGGNPADMYRRYIGAYHFNDHKELDE